MRTLLVVLLVIVCLVVIAIPAFIVTPELSVRPHREREPFSVPFR
jgi:hypothetical protein